MYIFGNLQSFRLGDSYTEYILLTRLRVDIRAAGCAKYLNLTSEGVLITVGGGGESTQLFKVSYNNRKTKFFLHGKMLPHFGIYMGV